MACVSVRLRGSFTGLAVVVLAALAGCGQREFAEVEGVVTVDGKPLEGIEVVFLPDPEKGNKGNSAVGVTDKQGRYKIRSDRDNKDGTVLGPHRVLLIDTHANKDPAGLAKGKPSRVPTEYSEAGQTPLKGIEITSGPQERNFELKSKRAED